MPDQIKIICNDMKSHGPGGNFTVIADGHIALELTWDEMLGQVASLTLTGKPRYHGYAIGENSCFWRKSPKLLSAGKEIFPF